MKITQVSASVSVYTAGYAVYDPVSKRDAANFAIIVDLTEHCMHLAYDNPCENEFDKYYI